MPIKLVEVGPRDGLQNEAKTLTLAQKTKLITKLSDANLKNLEVGSFVSSKWVPQMKGSDKLVKKLIKMKKQGQLNKQIKMSALVPNAYGMNKAIDSGIKEVAIFTASSEKFAKKNINCSIKESFSRFEEVMSTAKKNKIKVRGYLSTAFGCPYEGKVSSSKVAKLTEKLFDLGVYEVSIGDTIGVANPKQVRKLITQLKGHVPLSKVAMHFHDTRGTALANVLASLDLGIQVFDSSVAGLGGCPYAKGASGNLATEDLCYMLEGMGLRTGVDIHQLIKTKKWLEKLLDKKLPSKVGDSGLPLR